MTVSKSNNLENNNININSENKSSTPKNLNNN